MVWKTFLNFLNIITFNCWNIPDKIPDTDRMYICRESDGIVTKYILNKDFSGYVEIVKSAPTIEDVIREFIEMNEDEFLLMITHTVLTEVDSDQSIRKKIESVCYFENSESESEYDNISMWMRKKSNMDPIIKQPAISQSLHEHKPKKSAENSQELTNDTMKQNFNEKRKNEIKMQESTGNSSSDDDSSCENYDTDSLEQEDKFSFTCVNPCTVIE